ncbi:uncharacterized protein K441DRAFT_668273 [Cenococcum geophilum 1.58]|uniref:uncharacterized protein n=1 Tax=Cenococcum geophilum 1.58 TaxID=794803 RepID=UPI00358F84A5|nr:hypothetical protein K441DRAFT_668273 [Cenococcum geophilum 1.58]
MKPSLITLLSLPLLALALALPKATPTTSATPTPTLTPTGPLYHLRTRLKPVSAANATLPAHLAGLWLYASHTGAGLNDPLFASNRSWAIAGFLNATDPAGGAFQEFDLGNYWPYGFNFRYEPYAGWSEVEVNAGQGNVQGFGFAESGGEKVLVMADRTQWGGWLVCDWWHNAPQLFWRYKYYTPEDYPAPSSCADVDLVRVLV